MTIDAVGEVDSTVLWKADSGEFEKILEIPFYRGSLGAFYERAAKKLGYGWFDGAGKLMGLAPYGRERKKITLKMNKMLKVYGTNNDVPYKINIKVQRRSIWKQYLEYDRLINKFNSLSLDWNKNGRLKRDVIDFAWGFQNSLERAILSTAYWAQKNVGGGNLGLAGGVALNSKGVMKVYYENIFNDIFTFPAATDAGTAIGAAAYVYDRIFGKMRNQRLSRLDFGPEYNEDRIKSVIERSNLYHERCEASQVAELISKGKIVAWFNGSAELGPRALGGRSIVADPRNKAMWLKINELKGREWWRPLAPSMLESARERYLKHAVHRPFMVMMFRVTDYAMRHIPAVCHVDRTTRPQTVKKNYKEPWYSLIRDFSEITGEEAILNTSFNLAGEPMVETPEDAIKSFSLGGFDAVYLDGWLIKKR